MRLSEVSPDTVEGSFSDDLILSKLWLIKKLSELRSNFGTIYVLGSWFGNLAMLMAAKELRFDRIINVDLDEKALANSERIIKKLGLSDRVINFNADANDLDYHDLGTNGLIVNTSCNNINGMEWFQRMPPGTMVALQGRNEDPGAVNKDRTLDEFMERYPMERVMFSGKITLRDDNTKYDRFMVIGKV